MILVIGLSIAPLAHAANGNFTELDQAGINVIIELRQLYEGFSKAAQQPQADLKVFLTQWTFLLKTNVKQYVENYSTVVGIQDSDLKRNFNLLLQINDALIRKVNEVQNYEKLKHKLKADVSFLTESLLEPLEQIEQDIKNVIVPKLEKQSFYISVEKKSKAKEMLLRVFDLERLIAAVMMKYTAAIIYMDLK